MKVNTPTPSFEDVVCEIRYMLAIHILLIVDILVFRKEHLYRHQPHIKITIIIMIEHVFVLLATFDCSMNTYHFPIKN